MRRGAEAAVTVDRKDYSKISMVVRMAAVIEDFMWTMRA